MPKKRLQLEAICNHGWFAMLVRRCHKYILSIYGMYIYILKYHDTIMEYHLVASAGRGGGRGVRGGGGVRGHGPFFVWTLVDQTSFFFFCEIVEACYHTRRVVFISCTNTKPVPFFFSKIWLCTHEAG